MVKLLKIASARDMIQLDLGDGKTPTWAHCPSAIKVYATQNLKLGDVVDIVSEQQNDGLHVTKISAVGMVQPPPKAINTPATTGAAVGPTTQTPVQQPKDTGNYRLVSPDTQRLIVHQSTMASACTAVQSIICQIEDTKPDVVAEYILTVYRKLLAEVEK
jgi:hypothetical protein